MYVLINVGHVYFDHLYLINSLLFYIFLSSLNAAEIKIESNDKIYATCHDIRYQTFQLILLHNVLVRYSCVCWKVGSICLIGQLRFKSQRI